MKPGDWIDVRDITDEAMLDRIQVAVGAYSCPHFSTRGPHVCALYMGDDGNLHWSYVKPTDPKKQIDVQDLLNRATENTTMKPGNWIALSDISGMAAFDNLRAALQKAGYKVYGPHVAWINRTDRDALKIDGDGDLVWVYQKNLNPAKRVDPSVLSTPQGHPHADNMRLYAEDAAKTTTPWKLWEHRRDLTKVKSVNMGKNNPWRTLCTHPIWSVDHEYRHKPKRTVHIGSCEFPAPETKAPEKGTVYYVVSPDEGEGYIKMLWADDEHDRRYLRRGLVFLTPDDASLAAKAVIDALGGAL